MSKRPQMSLKAFLAVIAVFAVLFAAAWPLGIASKIAQRRAVSQLEEMGVKVVVEHEEASLWTKILGRSGAGKVTGVYLLGAEITDDTLALLKCLKHVRDLNLAGTSVSDQDLASLAHLSELRSLSLSGTRIGDDGLVHLRSFGKLSDLRLYDTRVSDDGIRHLKTLRNLRELLLTKTNVSDDAIHHLAELPKLEVVWLDLTRVTEAGVRRLRDARPDIDVAWSQPREDREHAKDAGTDERGKRTNGAGLFDSP